MPAPKMFAGLPKPVLFGFYGAVGGLLGALVFGELVWSLLQPPPPKPVEPPPPEPRLAISASKDLQLNQGGTNKLFVQVARDFDGPVKLHAEGLPRGVTAADVKVPANATEAEIELRASFGVAVAASTPIKVVANATSGGKTVTATAPVDLATLVSPMPQVDIVFVLDVTDSMQEQIDGLKSGIVTFANDLSHAKVDARFGCVAFRDKFVEGVNGGTWVEVLNFGDGVFTSDAEAFEREVAKQRAAGGGDIPETSFEAISEAAKLDGWRKAASRVLILITDAPPKLDPSAVPPGGQSEEQTAKDLHDNKIDVLHLVIGAPRRQVEVNRRMQKYYRTVQKGAIGITNDKGIVDKGREFDLQTAAENAKTFTEKLLPEMTKAIVSAAEAKRPEAKPELETKRPEAPVLQGIKGVQSDATYEKSSSGQLVLAVGVWTGAIAALVCLFLLGGQHHYLRGTLPAAGGVLAGLGGGLLVGLVGGAAGQGLFLLADTDSKILDAIFRVMGWTILGSLAGLGLSLFVPNLKLVYGLVGGAIGGAVGALGYIAVASVANAFLGRLAGGLVLGLFIGLMVAIVEAAFRRAWLEVHYGPREMVTVNLGAEPVKVGGDARACTVWARGAADVALRYFIRDGRVVCTDVPSRSESVVGDGDTREAGNVTVVVRTGSGTAAAVPTRPAPPPLPRAKPAPAAPPLSLDDDLPMPAFDSPAPVPVSPPPPPVASAPRPPVARPPAPVAPRPAAPAPPIVPAIKPATRDPNACPTCGRKNAGSPGARYCMVCDQTY